MITAALLAAGGSFLILAAVFVPLERAFPARSKQPVVRPAVGTDVLFFVGQYVAWSSLAVLVLSTVQGILASAPGDLLYRLAQLPIAAKIAVAIFGGDLTVYWFHRACHSVPLLWRFHAVHHSSQHLDWLAAHREHPVDGILTQLAVNLPAFVVGLPIELLAGFAVFRGMWAVFVHSNVRLPLGPLRVLLGAPELHHWHHANVEHTRHNFANVAPWVDKLFGTYHLPESHAAGREEAYPLGLPEPASAQPPGYFAQLIHPLLPARRGKSSMSVGSLARN